MANWIQRLLARMGAPAGASISVDIAALQTALTALGLQYIEGSVDDVGPAAADFDTDLAEVTNDHYNGMLLMFTDADLAGQAHVIEAYVGAAKNVAFSAEDIWTEAPGNGDNFIILPAAGVIAKAIFVALGTHDTDIKALLATVQADLDDPAQYKATGFATSGALTAHDNALTAAKVVIDAIKGIVDVPANFMADVTALALETSLGTHDTDIKNLLATIAGYIDVEIGTIITNVGNVATLVAATVMGKSQIAATNIDLDQAAASYDLFTGTTQVVILESLNIKMPTGAAGGALTSISIQTDDATPGVIISDAVGAVENLESEADLAWVGSLYITVGTKIRLTIAGGAHGASYVCKITAKCRAVVSGGYLS